MGPDSDIINLDEEPSDKGGEDPNEEEEDEAEDGAEEGESERRTMDEETPAASSS